MAASALGIAMIGWLGWGSTSNYAATEKARIEVESTAHPVQPEVSGVVVKSALRLGQPVLVGDVLVELDSEALRIQLEGEQTRLETAEVALAALGRQVDAERMALDSSREEMGASRAAARARGRVAESALGFAEKYDKVYQDLHKEKVVSGLEALTSASQAEGKKAEAEAARAEARRISAAADTEQRDRVAGLTRIETQAVELSGQIRVLKSSIRSLKFEIERRTLKAKLAGSLAEVTPVTPGTTVQAGDVLAYVVPPSRYRVVAQFKPDVATGRIAPGQPAIMRLDAFPWAQYGIVDAKVAGVAREPRSGTVRVELDIDSYNPAVPISHGLTGSVEVNVERVSAAALLLRAGGQMIAGPVKPKPPKPPPGTTPAPPPS